MDKEAHIESSTERPSSSRKVYTLPKDLIDRVVAYQSANGLSSEAEAVRLLLDIGLRETEGLVDLLRQMASARDQGLSHAEAAKHVLAGHPKVASISFDPLAIRFDFKDKREQHTVTFYSGSHISFQNSEYDDRYSTYDINKTYNLKVDSAGRARLAVIDLSDDNIPF